MFSMRRKFEKMEEVKESTDQENEDGQYEKRYLVNFGKV